MIDMAADKSTGPQHGQITVGDGVHLHYQHHAGAPGGRCVVLLHSLGMDHTFWRLVAPLLYERASVICVDVRGHGQSSKPPGPYSIALFAQDVKQLTDALGYKRVIVAGASMGGCIAMQFAAAYPDSTVALGLFDTTSWYGETAASDWAARAEKARQHGFKSMVDFQVTRWFSDSFRATHPTVLQDCVDTFVRNDLDAYMATCHAMGSFDARDATAGLRIPTAIIVGSEDYAAPPKMSDRLHQAIPGSKLTIIPGARHLTPLEVPDTIAAALLHLIEATGADMADDARASQGH